MIITRGIRAVTLAGCVGVNIRTTVRSGPEPGSTERSPGPLHFLFFTGRLRQPSFSVYNMLEGKLGCTAALGPGRKVLNNCVCGCVAFRAAGILATLATAQCAVWISRCFLVSRGSFCERGMMCIVSGQKLSAERRPLLIAGVRPSAMVMKAASLPRSSARAVACRVVATLLCTSLLMCLY